MSNLITRLEAQPLADHRTIAILDEGGALPFPTSADWLELADNSITIMTLASEMEVPLAVEVWDDEPPPATLAWSVTGEGRVRFETGRIGINFLVEGDHTVEFEIAHGIYCVRVHAAGRPDLARPTTQEPTAHCVEPERYLVQIWPSSRHTRLQATSLTVMCTLSSDSCAPFTAAPAAPRLRMQAAGLREFRGGHMPHVPLMSVAFVQASQESVLATKHNPELRVSTTRGGYLS